MCRWGGYGECRDRHAFIEFVHGKRLVSTVSFCNEDDLTIGEYFQGRIDDLNYCLKNKDSRTLSAEFEKWDDEIHKEEYTCEYGVELV